MNNTLDQLNAVSFTKAQEAAFAAINALQNYNQGQQVAAAAMLLHLLCDRFKINPREAMTKGHQVLQDTLSFGHGEHTRAIKAYINKEL